MALFLLSLDLNCWDRILSDNSTKIWRYELSIHTSTWLLLSSLTTSFILGLSFSCFHSQTRSCSGFHIRNVFFWQMRGMHIQTRVSFWAGVFSFQGASEKLFVSSSPYAPWKTEKLPPSAKFFYFLFRNIFSQFLNASHNQTVCSRTRDIHPFRNLLLAHSFDVICINCCSLLYSQNTH